ncbi:hypothetical protein [Kordiimonas marina]|uniref:hypothetical protein n=1 Tax=Kordiimonas marina TaxID=2872312 RepID=UPI001FF3C262|nr:hypothetical protein [Kordiimonas marina]MCJ9428702.1 hypothetical protein [Kordiimonas marina]
MTPGTDYKREYFTGGKVLPLPEGDGSHTANAALLKATLALDRIERHEEECGRRWGLVIKLMLVAVAQLGGLLIFLVTDKLEWLQ